MKGMDLIGSGVRTRVVGFYGFGGGELGKRVLPIYNTYTCTVEELVVRSEGFIVIYYCKHNMYIMGADDFVYDVEHRVVVCRRRGTCLAPGGPKSWRNHLGQTPHYIKDEELRSMIQLLLTYNLQNKEELRDRHPSRGILYLEIKSL